MSTNFLTADGQDSLLACLVRFPEVFEEKANLNLRQLVKVNTKVLGSGR